MINLIQILEEYPKHLHSHRESILKEYLQYKILQSIFDSKFEKKLAFLGGTALRIVHGSTRFSEDLDFDNFDLSEAEFIELGEIIKKDLEAEGLEVEIKTKTKNAYRIKIRIPQLLFNEGLSSMPEHQILIQVDTVPQNFKYTPNRFVLNKFEVFANIATVPKELLLAQKLYACVNRNRIMGRDFFDVVFLYGIGAKPNFDYLKKNLGVENEKELREYLLEKTTGFDFKELSKDVAPFLFNQKDKNKVEMFPDFIKHSL
ncbi:MAG TPA: nucleotidyl transferase AbiEii/AbiGii toxin family protein [Candidatus Gracilibacteria bacterium]|nr:nucleotidyl transferase AbiEii/AbiGii toxin family protein [Candidatus Gracilibacteria bacterium]